MINTPYNVAVAITKSNTDNIPGPGPGRLTDAIYVGGAGVVAVVLADDRVVNITAVAGAILPIAAKRVNDTNTTATVMAAFYCA